MIRRWERVETARTHGLDMIGRRFPWLCALGLHNVQHHEWPRGFDATCRWCGKFRQLQAPQEGGSDATH